MSVIAIEGFSLTVTLHQVVKLLSKSIEGDFKPTNFLISDCNTTKTCYVQLSGSLNPLEVIGSINNCVHGRKMNVLKAFLPDTIPKFPPKPVFLHKNLRRKLGIPGGQLNPKQIRSVAHLELMTELQFKYPLLCDYSMKSAHRLLKGIGETVQERLEKIMACEGDHCFNPSLLTERYRTLHPHFGDFKMIRNHLHGQEDAAKEFLTRLQEYDLTIGVKEWKRRIFSNWDCSEKIQAFSKYNHRIGTRLEQYVQSYNLTPNPRDSKEIKARKEIQAELAQIVMSQLPSILHELKVNHFPKVKPPNKYEKIRMYGEPCLPPDELLQKMFKRFKAQRVSRRKTIFNLIVFDVPVKTAFRVMELDGTFLGESKLVMRSTYVNCHLVTATEKNAVKKSTQVDAKETVDTAQTA